MRPSAIYTPPPTALPRALLWREGLICSAGGVAGALLLLAGVGLWAGSRFDWIALHASPWLRIATLGGVIALCGIVYFGALWAMGFRFRDFRRESH